MEYRKLPHGGEKISILGLGNSSMGAAGEKEIEATVALAGENGINYFDMAAGDAVPFPAYGRALSGCREKVYFQIHFGADYRSGKYGWTLNLEEIKRSVDWQLKALRTDYIDFGFIHCIDEEADLEKTLSGGTVPYLQQLKKEGVVRHIGLSSHTPSVVMKMLDTGLLDMLMFSINPAYDYRHGEYAVGSVDERAALYRRCQAAGVGISVMKAFSGGQLLRAETSPFKQARNTSGSSMLWISPVCSQSFPACETGRICVVFWGSCRLPLKKRITRCWAPLRLRTPEGSVYTATIASPAPPGWMWDSSINIMILLFPGMNWLRTIT